MNDSSSTNNDEKSMIALLEKQSKEVATLATSLKEKENLLENKLIEFESLKNDFNKLKEDYNKKNEVLLLQSKEITEQIIASKTNSENELKEIKTSKASVQKQVNEIQSFFTNFQGVRDQTNDPNTGVQACLKTIQESKNKSEEIQNIIQVLKVESENKRGNIEQLNVASTEFKNNIEMIKEISQSYKDEIGKYLELITDSSLADSFYKRKNEIKRGTTMWLWLIVGTIACFIYINTRTIDQLLAIDMEHQFLFWKAIVIRLLFALPLGFLVGFGVIQYVKDRNYIEQYSFKAAKAVSLQSYAKLLTDRFSDKENFKKDLLGFILKSIEGVYEPPKDPRPSYEHIEEDKESKKKTSFSETV